MFVRNTRGSIPNWLRVRYFSSCQRSFKAPNGGKSQAPANFLGRASNNLSVGLVGLANVGKSSIFQILTRQTSVGTPANYPFATIEPTKSIINVPSIKLDHYQKLFQSNKKIESNLLIWDIAGLIRNASSGAGLGNKFLNDIRNVDGIFHVIRGFRDDDIIHIEENKVDPLRDLVIVNDELILKDLEFVEIGIDKLTKLLKRPGINKAEVENEINILERIQELLYEGKKVSQIDWNAEEVNIINPYNFLTAKPTLYLLNVNENDYLNQTNEFLESVTAWLEENSPRDKLIMISADHETTLLEQEVEEETVTGSTIVAEVITTMKSALNLISFYTCGPKEAHEWNIRMGNTVQEAAGCIHTDLQKTFISSIVYKWDDLKTMDLFNETTLKSSGKQYKQGKKYLVEDGDVIIIKAGSAKVR
ncbi:P-loop containing nucleoside triphosphate hydrolase protein [Scheffersomyces amazonensis]|uniref:P-loop containing nucleoside triphosphate hydrolase protein n=1 Tax=Scheffersomyces amazonensis TaxID=1078765 RepID=UPI00315DD766